MRDPDDIKGLVFFSVLTLGAVALIFAGLLASVRLFAWALS